MGEKNTLMTFRKEKIKRSDYLEKNQVGWVVTYIRPLEEGKNNIGNVIIMHHRTFEEWNFQYPEFSINGVNYRIHYEERAIIIISKKSLTIMTTTTDSSSKKKNRVNK